LVEFLPLLYPPELEVKETTDTASSASFLDLYLEFDDSGQISTKIYDKRYGESFYSPGPVACFSDEDDVSRNQKNCYWPLHNESIARCKHHMQEKLVSSFLDLYLEFDDSGQISTKIYDKRYDFNFKILNFPNMCSNIPASPAYGVYISQLIRYPRATSKGDKYVIDEELQHTDHLFLGVACFTFLNFV
jgi:hypothetical protein